ncbi:MAG: ribosome silencing factor [Rubricoccaceae bacterium]|nr:ribosome silencing factor [Rubricoccaceae bacterium]
MTVATSTQSERSKRVGPVPGHELARLAVEAALSKKALDVTVMDLRGISGEVDYFVLCTGESDVQIRAIMEAVIGDLKEKADERPSHREGIPGATRWIVLDYFDLAVHIFDPTLRAYYDLERLWGDAPRETVSDDFDSIELLEEVE